MKAPLQNANFGLTADDYLTHRAGFPESLFRKFTALGIGKPGQKLLDLGTGTGTLARGFATLGAEVYGADPAEAMLDAARILDEKAGVSVNYRVANAEETGFEDRSFDVITAGQCWHWFDAPAACREIRRLLRPGGLLTVAYYDWLPLAGNVVRQTEELIEAYNPAWRGGNLTGIHPGLFRDLGEGGFSEIESFTYDEPAIYSHEGWRGRIRASAGVGATLSDEEVSDFDRDLAMLLKKNFSREPLQVPHRVFAVTAR